jgi:hypothetical protein
VTKAPCGRAGTGRPRSPPLLGARLGCWLGPSPNAQQCFSLPRSGHTFWARPFSDVSLPLGSGAPLSSEPGTLGDRLVTTREVAESSASRPRRSFAAGAPGELPGYRLASNVLRFRESEVRDWLEVHRDGPRVAGGNRPEAVGGTSTRLDARSTSSGSTWGRNEALRKDGCEQEARTAHGSRA